MNAHMNSLQYLHRRTFELPFISFVCLLLTFPPLHFSIFAWVGFVPLLIFTWQHPKPLKDFLVWYSVGLMYWAIGVNAVVAAYGVEMYLKMIVAAALPMGILGLVSSLAALHIPKRAETFLLCVPGLVWVILLTLFSLTSIQTMPLEVFFAQPLPLMQIATLGNMHVLIFLILTTNTAIALIVLKSTRMYLSAFILCCSAALGIYAWGAVRLNTPVTEGTVNVALIQSNFPMSMDWREQNAAHILDSYTTWADEAATHDVEMIVFPEYNLSRVLSFDETVEFFSNIARKTNTTVIAATYSDLEKTSDGKEGQYNVALAFTQTGMLQPVYATNVNLPFRKIGELFKEGFEPVDTPIGEAGLFVCYDSSARSVAQKWQAAGADYFIVMTNPSTFSGPIVTGLQFIQDHLRAIESHTTVIRLATNGPSAVIDPYGRTQTLSKRGEQTILYAKLKRITH